MTQEIPLTQGHVAIVDDADAARALAAGSWCALVRSYTIYAMRGARRPDGVQTTIRLHNFLTGWQFVDHINGDGLDNRRSNLRPADHRTNARNRAKVNGTTSPYKGVYWCQTRQRWLGQIRLPDRRRVYLGQNSDPLVIARAYDAAALIHFGEYARLNFPRQENAA